MRVTNEPAVALPPGVAAPTNPSFGQPAVSAPASLTKDLLIALAVALGLVAFHAIFGFPTLSAANGDNDSMLRLVEVRDLLAGQGWFDLHQFRMGLEGGFVMHWSRFVDAPIAALIWLGTALTGNAKTGELGALVVWPTLLMFVSLACLMRMARRIAGDQATLPAMLLSAAALHFTGVFAPGSIDHHNVQLALTLVVLVLLAVQGSSGTDWRGIAAGGLSTVSIAVGMETAPYVVVACMVPAVQLLVDGTPQARGRAQSFGLGLALAAVACLVATVEPSSWLVEACDAYSLPQASLAVAGGAGLALVASLSAATATAARRIVALGLLGAALAAFTLLAFPQCLADPYAGLDPRLQENWLGLITEAQSIRSMFARAPDLALGFYVTPLLGLAVLAFRLWRRWATTAELILAPFLAIAVLVSCWQVRGAMFAIPLASVPLAVWATEARLAARAGGAMSSLRMILVWLVALNMTWSTLGTLAFGEKRNASVAVVGSPQSSACDTAQSFAPLAVLPTGRVLAVSNLGAAILRYTGHSVLAGPYHRNVDGNLLALDALMGTPDKALALLREHKIDYVVDCPGNDETRVLSERAPDGLLASMRNGARPEWLTTVGADRDSGVRVFRVAGR